jgi:alpha-1,3-rhamnosyl/mannosyltransferase
VLSVANFQPRKNLERLIRAFGRLSGAASGELALVLLGSGSDEERARLDEAVATLPGGAIVARPGYREGVALRAAYAEATALVFPSLCESFGIPIVEAMAQSCPVAIACTTAMPEVAGPAGWLFDPEDEESITETLRELIGARAERSRRVAAGELQARQYRWERSCGRLVEAMRHGAARS